MKEDKKYTIPKKYIDIGLMAVYLLEFASLIYNSIELYFGKDTETTLFTIIMDTMFLVTVTIYKIVRICRKRKQQKDESLTE